MVQFSCSTALASYHNYSLPVKSQIRDTPEPFAEPEM